MRYNKRNNAGFTLIEIIAVLIILAIISAVAVSRVGSSDPKLRAEVNDLKAALRYAQQMAIASDSTSAFGINVASGSYTLVGAGATSLPGESSNTHSFSSGITATVSPSVIFNEWGGVSAGNKVVTLTDGVESKTITVISETGYAHE